MTDSVQSLQEKIRELKMTIAHKTEHVKEYKFNGSKDYDQQRLNLLEKALSDQKDRKLLNG